MSVWVAAHAGDHHQRFRRRRLIAAGRFADAAVLGKRRRLKRYDRATVAKQCQLPDSG